MESIQEILDERNVLRGFRKGLIALMARTPDSDKDGEDFKLVVAKAKELEGQIDMLNYRISALIAKAK